ncbi:MAG: RagB/SusD family nutrient uptake outer membrane protein [Chitinophagaceae bacterium]
MINKKLCFGLMIAGVVALVTTIVSCDKTLDKTDPNAVTTDQYFKNSTELQKAANSIYSTMHSLAIVGREWFFLHDTRSDEVASGGPQLEVPRFQLLTGVHDPTNSVMNTVWNGLYVMIHRANTVIANGPNVTDNNVVRDRCVGEAKFLRAWAYFELVSMWGPVPMSVAPIASPDQFQPRSKEDDLYTQITKDLNDAIAVLPAKTGTDKGRATKSAAYAMLGRVLMQKGDYPNAKTALLAIPTVGADGYGLTARYLDNFEEETEFNKESIFEVVFNDKGDNNFNWGGNGVGDDPAADQSTVRNQEYCAVAWRNLIPSDKYLDNFESTATGATKSDPRFTFSVYKSGDLFNNGSETITDGSQNGYSSTYHGVSPTKMSWRKYTIIYKEGLVNAPAVASFHPGGDNQRMIRYAEVLLMLAECENEANNIPGALGYLNQIRDRADVAMPHYPTTQFLCTNKAQVTAAIMHEKMSEMGCEEVRNIDILRWRKKGYFTTDPLPYFQANKHELLPIPQAEEDNNPKLGSAGVPKQNPGY